MYSMFEKCGVILHYHINKCAGDSMGRWFQSRSLRFKRLYHNPVIRDPTQSKVSWKKDIESVYKWLNMTMGSGRTLLDMDENSKRDHWAVLEIHHGIPGNCKFLGNITSQIREYLFFFFQNLQNNFFKYVVK
eukprot:UN27159